MKFKRVLVIYKDSIVKGHRELLDELKNTLGDYSIKNLFLERSGLNKKSVLGRDLVLTVGGDGTLLRASHFIDNQSVLGINYAPRSSEGALCLATRYDFKEKLKKIISGQSAVKELTRARVFFLRSGRRFDALNEIYAGSSCAYRVSKYFLRFGRAGEEQKSSGIIISTGTGSSAWYGSIIKEGFPGKSRELRFVVREPYFGKLGKFNSLKGKITGKQKLGLSSKMDSGIVAVDSMIEIPFDRAEEIEAGISPEPLRLVSFD